MFTAPWHYTYFAPGSSDPLDLQITTAPGVLSAVVLPAGGGTFTLYDSASGSTANPICQLASSGSGSSSVVPIGATITDGLYLVAGQPSRPLTVLWAS